MSETWYEAWSSMNRIQPVQIERHTMNSVWIDGKRRARLSWLSYFPTWAEAHGYLLKHADQEVEHAKSRLDYAHGRRGNVLGMKQPVTQLASPDKDA